MTVQLTTTGGPVNVTHAVITESLEGAWRAAITVDTDEAVTGPVTLDNDGTTAWVGSVRRGAQEHGVAPLQVVGGGGGLSTILGAQGYSSASLLDVLGGIATDAGEVLSPDIGTGILAALVAKWVRRTGPAGLSIKQVANEADADHWRIRRDGLLWVGLETWPANPAFEYTEISRDPEQGKITIAPEDDQVLVAVGDSFLDRNVGGVVTTITPGSVRQEVFWVDDDGSTTQDRVLGPFNRAIESAVGRRIDYAQMYPSKVNAQNGDGTLDITPDDELMRGDGLKNIAITYGTPGMSATGITGKVNLYFQNADPKLPRAALFEGSGVGVVTVGGGSAKVVALNGDGLSKSSGMVLWMSQVEVAVNTAAPGSVTPLSTTFTLGTVDGSSSKLKSE